MQSRSSWWALAIVVAWYPSLARAGEEEDRALALQLGREAVELYNAQRYEDALDRFTNAESLVHSPVFVLYIARIERKRGHWVRALGHYDKLHDKPLPDDAPSAWQRAREEGRLERERLLADIPTLRITIEGADDRVSVWLDGTALSRWSVPFAVDPGRHQVVAQHGQRSASARVEVAAGQKNVAATVRFATGPVRAGPAPTMARAAPQSVLAPQPVLAPVPNHDRGDAPLSDQRKAGYALVAIGGAAATAFAGVSIAAVIRDRQLNDKCIERVCPEAFEPDLAEYNRLRSATLGLGAASAALFITGWIVAGTAPPGEPSTSTSVSLGPTGATLRVRF